MGSSEDRSPSKERKKEKKEKKDKKSKKKEKKRDRKPSPSPDVSQKKIKQSEDSTEPSWVGSKVLDEYPIPKPVVNSLKARGVEELFPIQVAAFPHVYHGRDIVAKARTGTGKTFGFALPIITKLLEENLVGRREPLVLVVLPTRELAIQVARDFMEVGVGVRSTTVYGGAPIYDQERDLRRGVEVVVGTPGRLIDHLERKNLSFDSLKFVVLDEADEMLNMGFADDVEKILSYVPPQLKVQKCLFSATVPHWVKKVAQRFLDNPVTVDLVGSDEMAASKNVRHLAIMCDSRERMSVLSDVIKVYGANTKVLVFCNTKAEANRIATESDIRTFSEALHGDVPQVQREKTTESFRQGMFKCLIATDVAARGLDISGIGLVIQTQPPKEAETYIHRSGRTGRAGVNGVSILFYTKRETSFLRMIERQARFSFDLLGAPQAEDLIGAAAEAAKEMLDEVHPDVIPHFEPAAQALIDAKGAVPALAAALARLTNQHEELKTRSLMTSMLGYTSILCTSFAQVRSPMYLVNSINYHVPNAKVGQVNLLEDGMGGVVEVPSEFVDAVVAAKDRNMTFEVCKTLPPLQERQNIRSGGGGRGGGGRGGGGYRGGGGRGGGGRGGGGFRGGGGGGGYRNNGRQQGGRGGRRY